MKKLTFFFAACIINQLAYGQYWQQKVDVTIEVSLNDIEKTLDGFERIVYTNNSPDTLKTIWFHLWPNAYKNDRTAFSEQLLTNGDTRFYFSSEDQKGYINRLSFMVNGVHASTQDHPQHIDIVNLILPKPLAPGASAIISTPFHVKLPYNFSRGGYTASSFQITQWFPKPAVYDSKGWHPLPYLDQGEFYSEFGDYDVKITLPKNYVVAATGVLQDAEEMQWLETRRPQRRRLVKKIPPTKKAQALKTKVVSSDPVPGPVKTVHFIQKNVHDFAWFADTAFMMLTDTCALPSGNVVKVQSYYTRDEQPFWDSSVLMAKDALRFYASRVGNYPFETLSIVQGTHDATSGGMEYPTIALITPYRQAMLLDEVIAHEIGHNWFYSMLASNERQEPWMDEGLNTYYEKRYMEEKYGLQEQAEAIFLETKSRLHTAQPIRTPSADFQPTNYGLSAYYGTAIWLQSLGREKVDSLMQQYFMAWSFRHPQPEDFKSIFAPALGDSANDFFSKLDQPLHQSYHGFRIVSPLKPSSISGYLKQPPKDALFISPAIGVNQYDRFMAGAILTNYKLPQSKFQFLAVPLYSTGAKQLKGLGRLSYSILTDKRIRKTDLFVNGSSFSMDDFTDTSGRRLIMGFRKLVPGFRMSFRERDQLSTRRLSLQWKTYLFREEGLRIVPDTIFNGTDTTLRLLYSTPAFNRYLNQLSFHYEQFRELYPYDIHLVVEQASDFVRPTITMNYFFNYKDGGLSLRVFAGKFIYTKPRIIARQFANERYFLQMTGANGFEDYQYSQYFMGRNEFEGFTSQQIMIRDGGFKVRSDLLADKIGQNDNWLAAINLNTSIPDRLNPLRVLPVKIPLHLFLDIGTEAGAWERETNEDRFLFDAGIHIPLFAETVNFYFPLFYNKVYGDYFKATIPKNRFFKTMSFTIDLNSKAIRKANRETEF